MKKTTIKTRLSLLLCMVLIVAMALFTTGCSDDSDSNKENPSTAVSADKVDSSDDSADDADVSDDSADDADASGVTKLGEGSTEFTFTVVDADGSETVFDIYTDAETVGEALVALDLIAGDDSEYGLYVKTVNGVTVDYDTDGKYWAFYIDGEYAMTGVDSTEITEGQNYTFKVE